MTVEIVNCFSNDHLEVSLFESVLSLSTNNVIVHRYSVIYDIQLQ